MSIVTSSNLNSGIYLTLSLIILLTIKEIFDIKKYIKLIKTINIFIYPIISIFILMFYYTINPLINLNLIIIQITNIILNNTLFNLVFVKILLISLISLFIFVKLNDYLNGITYTYS